MICRHCGATLPPIAMFCGSCGRSVAARTPVVPPVLLSAAAPVFSASEVLSITPATPPEPSERSEPAVPATAAAPIGTANAPRPLDPEARADAPAEPAPTAPAAPPVGGPPVPPARPAPVAPPVVCGSCGTEGERDDLFCAECGAAMPQDTRVIERLDTPSADPRGAAPALVGTAAPEPVAPPEPVVPPAPEPAPLPGWASLLTGSSVPATSGPAARSTGASAVAVPGQPVAQPAETPAEEPPSVPPARPEAPAVPAPAVASAPPARPEIPVAPAPPVASAPPVAEPPVAAPDPRPAPPLPPLAPPPRLDPDVESTRLVPRSTTGVRFVLQFSTGESYTVVGSGLIGRNPRSEPGEVVDHLVTIVDPGRSVSKTHLEFGQDSGVFFVSDRHSGNGTIIREPGAEPRYADPGKRYRVVRGTRVDLGEQFVVIS